VAITCPCDHTTNGEDASNCFNSSDELAVCKCGNKVPAQILQLSKTKSRAIYSPSSVSSNAASTSGGDTKAIRHRITSITSTVDSIDNEKVRNCCSPASDTSSTREKDGGDQVFITEVTSSSSVLSQRLKSDDVPGLVYTVGSRPDIPNFIRGPVEATGGETAVAVCGGRDLVAITRNSVASLSDERAVHKGTGAQGIALHSESYCF